MQRTKNLTLIAVFTALIAVCAQIAVPSAIPFTLQTFAVFLTLCLLGGRRGTAAVVLYVLSGMVGLPVFYGFKGGIAALMGLTGGFILGFVGTALTYWLLTATLKTPKIAPLVGMLCGLAVCYLFGAAWAYGFLAVAGTPKSVGAVLSFSVLPYILLDLIKLTIAFLLSERLKKIPSVERILASAVSRCRPTADIQTADNQSDNSQSDNSKFTDGQFDISQPNIQDNHAVETLPNGSQSQDEQTADNQSDDFRVDILESADWQSNNVLPTDGQSNIPQPNIQDNHAVETLPNGSQSQDEHSADNPQSNNLQADISQPNIQLNDRQSDNSEFTDDQSNKV